MRAAGRRAGCESDPSSTPPRRVRRGRQLSGRSSEPIATEFVAALGVVIEEADESELWLDILETRRHGPPDTVKRLRQEASELRAIFIASRRTAAAKLKKQPPPP